MDIWFWIWLASAVLFLVAEMFTAGFFLLPFGLGAGITAALAYFGVGIGWQWIAFVGISVLLLIVFRRFAEHITHEPPQQVAGDRLNGQEGVVLERIDPQANTGRVRVRREEWVAESLNQCVIEAGARVRAVRMAGVHLVVEEIGGSDSADTCEGVGGVSQ